MKWDGVKWDGVKAGVWNFAVSIVVWIAISIVPLAAWHKNVSMHEGESAFMRFEILYRGVKDTVCNILADEKDPVIQSASSNRMLLYRPHGTIS